MNHDPGHGLALVFGGLAVLLLAGRLGGHFATRARLPAVLGELSAGLLLGNLGLGALDVLRTDPVLGACAQIGVLLLLFEVGLESNPAELGRVGRTASLVAVVGVVAPLVLGAFGSAALGATTSLPAHLFVGATLAATSVGITARVLRDLGKTQSTEAKIILAAAVLDDVLGLVLLAVVSALVRAGDGGAAFTPREVGVLLARVVGFLVATMAAGRLLVPGMFRVASKLSGKGTLVTVSLALCFAYSYAAGLAGLAPPIGAFFAGLSIREKDYAALLRPSEGALSEQTAPLSAVFVPLFFVLTGARVSLGVFGEARAVALALALTVIAVVGKLVCGLCVRTPGVSRLAVGIGMIPRGEVGLIFATMGATLSLAGHPVVSAQTFAAVVVTVVLTSLLPPPLLARVMGGGSGQRTSGT